MIRIATESDIGEIVRMGRLFHEAAKHPSTYNPEAVMVGARNIINSPDGIALIGPHGFLLGMIVPVWFSRERQASELAWWADRDGLSLLRAFEKWAAERGANIITLAHLESNPENDIRVQRIYEKRGYHKGETAYMKVL